MKLSDLKYFVAVADELNFSTAAEKLFISQQALSKHIAQVESHCGMPLFIRRPHVQLTQAGEILYQYATKLLVIDAEMNIALEDNRLLHRGRLSVGMSYARSRTLLPLVLPRFLSLYPDIDFNLTVDKADTMLTKLHSHDIDLFLGYNSTMQPAFESIDLGEDCLYMIIPRSLLLGATVEQPKTLEELDLSALNHAPFLLYPAGNSIRSLSDLMFKRYNITPKIVLESLDNELQVALSTRDVGITFAPRSILLSAKEKAIALPDNVVALPIPAQDFSRRMQILYCKDSYLSRAAKSFISICQDEFLALLSD